MTFAAIRRFRAGVIVSSSLEVFSSPLDIINGSAEPLGPLSWDAPIGVAFDAFRCERGDSERVLGVSSTDGLIAPHFALSF